VGQLRCARSDHLHDAVRVESYLPTADRRRLRAFCFAMSLDLSPLDSKTTLIRSLPKIVTALALGIEC